ncbi:MAG: hypothetical protein WCO53_10750 [Deltaproteobacteria bacterium]
MKKYNNKKRLAVLLSILALALFLPVFSNAENQYLTKDQWSQKMIKDQAPAKRICTANAFLLTCFTPRTLAENPADKGKTVSAPECLEAADALTKMHLADGKSNNKIGVFYNRLPATLNDYGQKEYENKLTKEIMAQIISILNKQGSTLIRSQECDGKLRATFPR